MTEFSGARDNPEFDGNTIFLSVRDEIDVKYQQTKFECMQIFGYGIFKFTTEHKIIYYISSMGNKMIPYPILIVEINTYILVNRYDFIKNENIEGLGCSQSDNIKKRTLLTSIDDSIDPYDYHMSNRGEKALTKFRLQEIYSDHVTDEDDEDFEILKLLKRWT